MRIGIDFDNTIADYSTAFYKVARQFNWIPESQERSKKAVKSYFLDRDMEPKWTELQGIVYGKEIFQAQPYQDSLRIMQALKASGHQLFIISHKTLYPIIGEKVNFHDAARNWLRHFEFIDAKEAPLALEDVFFNETKLLKVQRIALLECDVFIDDLPGILTHSEFPESCQKVLFDPSESSEVSPFKHLHHWRYLPELL